MSISAGMVKVYALAYEHHAMMPATEDTQE